MIVNQLIHSTKAGDQPSYLFSEGIEMSEDKYLDGWIRRFHETDSDEKCGNCKHTDNNLGFFSLRCDLLDPTEDYNKVRSWNGCAFDPSKWEPANQKIQPSEE